MIPEKRPRGRPPVASEDELVQKSVRLKPSQWAKIEDNGGQPWLRNLIDLAPPVKKKPTED